MMDLFVRTHTWLARRRPWVLLAGGLILAGALALSSRLRLNEDYTTMLPMSNPAIVEQVEALKHLRQAERLFFDIHTAAPNAEVLPEAADSLEERLSALPGLGDTGHTFDGSEAGLMYDELEEQLPTLLSAKELRDVETRLGPDALQKRLAWLKRNLSQPQGLALEPMARTDPAGLGDAVLQRLRALQATVGEARIVGGRLTSPDGRHVLLTTLPDFPSADIERDKRLLDNVLRAARAVESQFAAGQVRVAVSGAHRMALDNATMIQQDSARTSFLATVAVAALMLASYRRHWLSFLSLVPTLFGALGAVLFLSLAGEPVSAVALGCGSILIGTTLDYGIYVLYQIDDSPPANREELARAVGRLAPTLTFGALTTTAAFLIMLASPVGGHRQLGAFGAMGVLLSAAFAIFILPLFLPPGAVLAARALPWTALLERLARWRSRQARAVWVSALGFSLLCGFGLLRLRFDGDLARFNGVTAETRRDERVVREVWAPALSLTAIVVSGASRDEALQKNEALCGLLEDLQARHAIESFASIAPLMPSAKTRQNNLRDWRSFWTEPRRAELSNSLASASAALGFRIQAFGPFLKRIAAPVEGQSSGPGTESALGRLLGEYCGEKAGRVSISTLAKPKDLQSYAALREAVSARIPGALLLNKAAFSDEIARIARRGLPAFGALVLALNALLLFLFLGRIELVGLTLLPMAAGVFWTLGVLGLAGLPIDMANFIFVIFVIGVGGDYSLFLLMAELGPLRGRTARTASTAAAVTLCALTTLLGIGALVVARHPALFSIGLNALLGISFSLLASLILIPAGVARLRRRAAERTAASSTQAVSGFPARRRQVGALYRYQGPYVCQFAYWKMRLDPLFEALEAVVPRQGEILDLGCGYGIVAHWLALGAAQRVVLGADSDERKIRVARAAAALNPRVSFDCADVLSWEYPACDCVLLCDVLHYLPHELKALVLRKACAALRPGGRLVVRDAFHEESRGHRLVAWSEKWAVRLGQNRTAHGLRFESLAVHQALVAEAGFAEIDMVAQSGLGSNQLLVAKKP